MELVKTLHIAGIVIWAAGLLALPLLLAQHEPGDDQRRYARLRRYTHYGYTHVVAPGAVVAIGAGTALVFLRELFVPWMFAKLAIVGLLIALHVSISGIVVQMGEQRREAAPRAWPFLAVGSVAIAGILFLVLAKPALDATELPSWLREPRGRQLPLPEVPT